jgi:membrane protein
MLVSLFPMVLLIMFVVSLVLRSPDSYTAVLEQFARVLPGGVDGAAYKELENTLSAVRNGTGLLGIISLLGLLWAGSGVFGCIEAALGKVHGYRPRDFIPGKIMQFLMILAMFVLTLVGIGGATVLQLLGPIAEQHGAGNIFTGTSGQALQILLSIITGLLLAGLIYGVVPREHLRVLQILPGTLLAGVGFAVLTQLFPLYIRLTEGGNRYGATFGLLLVLITYCSFLAQLLMIGACLNDVVNARRREQPTATGRVVPARILSDPRVDEVPATAQSRPTAAGPGGAG